jgi:hypothetical protein
MGSLMKLDGGPAMEEGPLLQICDGRDVKWDRL